MSDKTEETKKMCDENYSYFKKDFKNLYDKYANKFIVIKDQNVIGVFDTFDKAYEETIKTEELGTFLIQLCCNDNPELLKNN